MMTSESIIQQTRCWLENIIIGLNFCPFAAREVKNDTIRYCVADGNNLEANLHSLAAEFKHLDNHTDTETSLLIFNKSVAEFDDFLELIDYANLLLEDLGYLSIYQLAHFHPDYCFEGAEADDASNYTNRSPYPTLHILREKSLQQAINNHPDTAEIPNTNIKLANELGADKIQSMLDICKNKI